MSWSYSLPTGVAGYIISQSDFVPESVLAAGEKVITSASGKTIYQGEAKAWGMAITYFYVLYFAVLLIHRELRDEEKCAKKYGEDWKRYKKIVKWKILPGVY